MTTPYLDPHDKMRLESAREKNSLRPTVQEYNESVGKGTAHGGIYGLRITERGNPDLRRE